MRYERRHYQQELVRDIDAAAAEGHRSILAVLPTGGGKTLCFSSMAETIALQGKTVWALAHREELVDQMSEAFASYGVQHGLIKSGMSISMNGSKVGMIQTAVNHIHKMKPPDVLILDECHHTPAKQYLNLIAAMPPETIILGFTATPCRLDGKGLGANYKTMVLGPSVAELISLGFLVPPVVYRPQLIDTKNLHTKYGDFVKSEMEELLDEPTITGDAVEHYKAIAPGTSAVAFCVGIPHAQHVAEKFNSAGIPAAHVDGGMAKPLRKSIINKFKNKEILVLTSANLISEGFDCPGIETVIMLRPTKSESLYLQQVGRGLRPAEGKTRAIILDHVQNTALHGMPTAERQWCLYTNNREPRKKKDDEMETAVHTCPLCFLCYTEPVCPECKVEDQLSKDQRRIKTKEGWLTEVKEDRRNYLTADDYRAIDLFDTKEELQHFAGTFGIEFSAVQNALVKRAKSLDDLRKVGKLLEYDPGWALTRHQIIEGYRRIKRA